MSEQLIACLCCGDSRAERKRQFVLGVAFLFRLYCSVLVESTHAFWLMAYNA
jgi:hypothetical protein